MSKNAPVATAGKANPTPKDATPKKAQAARKAPQTSAAPASPPAPPSAAASKSTAKPQAAPKRDAKQAQPSAAVAQTRKTDNKVKTTIAAPAQPQALTPPKATIQAKATTQAKAATQAKPKTAPTPAAKPTAAPKAAPKPATPQVAAKKPATAKPAAAAPAAKPATPAPPTPPTAAAAPLPAAPSPAVTHPAAPPPAVTRPAVTPPAAPPIAALTTAPPPRAIPAASSEVRRPIIPERPVRVPSKQETFVEGDHVVYPTHGVGMVERIVIEDIAGHRLELIHITFQENRMTLRVPVTKARTAGLRKLASRKMFDEALAVLKGRARIKRTMWSRRAQEYEAKINSGDPLSIAEVVRDLHRNAGQPDQSFSERQIYEAAMDRLAAELAALDKTDKPTAVIKLAEFLKNV